MTTLWQYVLWQSKMSDRYFVTSETLKNLFPKFSFICIPVLHLFSSSKGNIFIFFVCAVVWQQVILHTLIYVITDVDIRGPMDQAQAVRKCSYYR